MDWKSITFILTIAVVVEVQSRIDRPRGVSLTKKVFYDSSKDFTCFDGSQTIPFSQVNDDYCDCNDGSDEPGTSACPHGQFHCTNAGFKPMNIPSSRVNDRICDCCDGSDEWKHEGLCKDFCKELWKSEREEMIKRAEAANKGYEIKKEYIAKGIAAKQENQKKIESLDKELELLKETEARLKVNKEDAEKLEEEMKTIEKKTWNEFRAKVQQHQETREAADAFSELDVNKDGSISIEELQSHKELDITAEDGEFMEAEAKLILGGDTADAPHFIEVVWKEIGSRYVKAPVEEKGNEATVEGVEKEEDDDDDDDENYEFPEDDDDDDVGEYEEDLDEEKSQDDEQEENAEPAAELIKAEQEVEEQQTTEEPVASSLPEEPLYNERTQVYIKVADDARHEFDENKDQQKNVEKEISSLKKTLAMDFGPDEAFQELRGNCYELDTHEYTYKLCPFDKTVQVPKNGGSETNLGRWGSWNGPETNKYSSMKYPNGLRCWNGPDRSTEVKISCGDQNKLLSASEPSRCEYRFEFASPAACELFKVPETPHDEL